MATGVFHSVLTNASLPAPGTGNPGDCWFVNATGLLWFVDGTGTVLQLLTAVPIPTIGEQGPQGIPGPTGPQGPALFFQGTYQGAPVEYQEGAITIYNNSLYLANTGPLIDVVPASSPFWTLLGSLPVQQSEILYAIDGAGQTPQLGFKGFIRIPYSLTLASWSLYSDQPTGSASLDVKWTPDSGFPNTVSIVAQAGPALTGAQKGEGSVSTWSPITFIAGDILEIDLLSASGVSFLTLALSTIATN